MPSNRASRWLGLTAENRPGRFSVMLFAILTLMIVQPLFSGHGFTQSILTVSLGFVLISALFAFRANRVYFVLASSLMAPAMVARIALVFTTSWTLDLVASVLLAAYLLVTAVALVSRLFTIRSVSLDMISAAICAYLLMGIAWGCLYAAMELANPQSFSVTLMQGAASTTTVIRSLHVFIYYSFVTLTTTGYGDIVPVSDVARIVSVLEAAFGTLYIAILVSRLVSLELAESMREVR